MKRGMAIQLNWILVLIAGAAIMLFFAGIINFAMKASEAKSNVEILNAMGSIASSIRAGEKLDKPITGLPKSEIRYECSRGGEGQPCSCDLKIGSGGAGFNIDPTLIFFAPSRMATPTLLVKSMDWDAPFRVANFLYFTSTTIRYVFVYDGSSEDFRDLIVGNVHSGLKKEEYEITELDKFKDKNDDQVKFGDFGVRPDDIVASELEGMDDEDASAIMVSGNENKGSISYYQKKEDKWEAVNEVSYSYLGLPQLLGAIFIDESKLFDTENYLCMQEKSFDTMHNVADAYKKRADLILAGYESPSSCFNTYNSAVNGLLELTTLTEDSYSGEIDILNLFTQISTIQAYNDNALTSSCALIY